MAAQTAGRARRPTPAEAALVQVYRDAEHALLGAVTDQVADVVRADDDDTPAARAAGATRVREAAEHVVEGLQRGNRRRIDAVMAAAAQQGATAAAEQLGGIVGDDPRINVDGLNRLAAATADRLAPAHAAILRTTPDAYRDIVARVAPAVLVGADTRRQATQRALWAFTDRGITGFTDRAGRRWSLTAYAEMAVRTAANRAAVDGQLDRLTAEGHNLVMVVGAADRCPLCQPWFGKILTTAGAGAHTLRHPVGARGRTVPVDVAGSVADARAAGLWHPNCFPGGTLVSAPSGVRASYSHWYEGDLVVIHAAGGDELSVTPNHPVLTPEGWVAAGDLRVGDRVLRHLGGDQGVGGAGPGDEQVPAPIGEIHDALREASPVPPVRVPASPEQFHGDGGDGDVEVVFADGLLRDRLLSERAQLVDDGPLVVGVTEQSLLARDSASLHALQGIGLAASGCVCGGGVGGALVGGHALHSASHDGALVRLAAMGLELLGHGAAAAADPLGDGDLGQALVVQSDRLGDPLAYGSGAPSLDRGPEHAERPQVGVEVGVADADGGRELADGLASSVAVSEVAKIERRDFAGHVYNLESGDGWYVAEGIVVHNCRCTITAYTPGMARPPQQPLDPAGYVARQRQRAIERHIRAHKARQATALDDVARKGEGRAVRAWQAAMRDHLAANPDLRRLSYREQVGAGNLPDTALRARVGPNGDPLGPKPPNQLTVDELDNAMAAAIAAEDLDLIGVLGDEMDRRDAERHAREARNARARGRRAAQADRRAEAQAAHLEELVNAGVGDEEATERAYGITRERQRRNEARARLVGNGYGYLGSFDKMARAAYKDALEEEWFRAENEAGELLSRKAQARGISDRALFLRNEAFARKWASDELKQWWDINGRLTYAQFVDGLVNGGARGTYRGGDFLQ